MSVPDDHPATPPGQNPQEGDPSMEDILASIRRILSEEETGPAAAHSADHGRSGEDVFDLDSSMMVPQQPKPAPPGRQPAESAAPAPSAADAPEPPASPLVAPAAASAAASSVGSLVRTLSSRSPQVYGGGPTLEDLVRDELRSLIKEWLDTNLPAMVERLVRSEIERVVGRAEH